MYASDNEPNSTTDFFWTAHNFNGLGQNDPMHLWITAGEASACDKCHCRSTNFTILNEETPSPTTISSTVHTATDTPSTPASPQDDRYDRNNGNLKLSLGLGLGLGIPLLITLTALATWLCVRRRRQQRQSQLLSQQKVEDHGNSNSRHYEGTPLNPAAAAAGWAPGYASSEEKSPERTPEPGLEPEMADSRPVMEMQADNTRAEAPAEGVRAELAGDGTLTKDVKGSGGWA